MKPQEFTILNCNCSPTNNYKLFIFTQHLLLQMRKHSRRTNAHFRVICEFRHCNLPMIRRLPSPYIFAHRLPARRLILFYPHPWFHKKLSEQFASELVFMHTIGSVYGPAGTHITTKGLIVMFASLGEEKGWGWGSGSV